MGSFRMAERKDLSLFALILVFFILNFMVKLKCFIQLDGINITLKVEAACDMEENYYYSSLLYYESSYYKPNKRCLCFLLLLVCGDIESQPGPDTRINTRIEKLMFQKRFENLSPKHQRLTRKV